MPISDDRLAPAAKGVTMIHGNKPFVKTGYLGLAVIMMSVLLLFVFPPKAPSLPEGFVTPIVAFEFIQTSTEVIEMFGGNNITVQNDMVRAMDLGNRLDYLYMCLYSAFLMMVSATCAGLSQNKYYYAGVALALAVLAADALENVQLLGITENIAIGNFNSQLRLLHFFTWIKWAGLALIFLTLSPWFLKGDRFSKIIGIMGIITFMLGFSAYMNRSVINEIFSLSVALMFILMIVYCFIYKTDKNA
jgi:hypothetical protein